MNNNYRNVIEDDKVFIEYSTDTLPDFLPVKHKVFVMDRVTFIVCFDKWIAPSDPARVLLEIVKACRKNEFPEDLEEDIYTILKGEGLL